MKYHLIALACASASMHVYANNNDTDIEIIEVYANKRAQAINQVAVTLSSLDVSRIEKEQLKDITAIGQLVPNLKMSQNAAEGTTPAINIRGVGLIDYNTSNTSPIAIYQDDVTVGSANNQIINLFDTEAIEVLRGPQGTLFGRNSTGGAILIRSRQPELDVFSGLVRVGKGNLNAGLLEGVANIPLSDNMATRIAVSSKEYDYSTNNLLPDAKQANMVQTDYRMTLLGQWDNFNALLKVYGNDWNGLVNPVGSLGVFKNPLTGEKCQASELGSLNCFDAFGFNDGSTNFHDVMVNNQQDHDTETLGTTLKLDYTITNNFSLSSITAVNVLKRQHGFNCDGSPLQLCEGNLGTEDKAFSQELRLSSQLSDGHVMLGLFYLNEDIQQDNQNDILRDLRGVLDPSLTATFYYDNDIDIEAKAIFAQYDHAFSEQFTVTLGARWTDETTRYFSDNDLNVVLDITNLEGVRIDNYLVSGRESDDNLSGKFALNYVTQSGQQYYYSLSNGYKSGGYYGGYLATKEQAELAAYGPESIIANELGARASLAEGDWLINAAVFHYDYQDQQVFMNQPSMTPNAPPLQLLENVASSTIYGLEIESKIYLSDLWTLDVSIGHLPHAKFDEYTDPLGNTLSDHRLPFTSEWNAAANVRYAIDLEQGELMIALGLDHQSEYFFDQNMNPYAKQDAITLWHANINYQIANWQFNLWGRNLTDEEYSHLRFDLSAFLGMLEDFTAEGRQYGASVTYQF